MTNPEHAPAGVLRAWRTAGPERLARCLQHLAQAIRCGEVIPTPDELAAIAVIVQHCDSEIARRGLVRVIEAMQARDEAPTS